MENLKKHKIAEGNTAEIFEIDEKKILKLFKTGYSKSTAYYEYNNHYMVSRVMENIPKLYEFIEENQRFGFIMEKVQGKSLASLMLDDYTFEQAMETFTILHKNWLTKTMDGAVPYTEWMLHVFNGKSNSGDLADKIKNLPSGNTLCHGDFHPYNIILTNERDFVIIDFANVCKAPKEYDVARTYFLLKEAVTEKIVAELYLEKMQMEYSDIRVYIEVLETLRPAEGVVCHATANRGKGQ